MDRPCDRPTAIVAGHRAGDAAAFLRWNQGQDLRQALITIAISIILADQMLAHFGGVAEDIAWPRNWDKFVMSTSGHPVHEDAPGHPRHGLVIGGALWFWLQATRREW